MRRHPLQHRAGRRTRIKALPRLAHALQRQAHEDRIPAQILARPNPQVPRNTPRRALRQIHQHPELLSSPPSPEPGQLSVSGIPQRPRGVLTFLPPPWVTLPGWLLTLLPLGISVQIRHHILERHHARYRPQQTRHTLLLPVTTPHPLRVRTLVPHLTLRPFNLFAKPALRILAIPCRTVTLPAQLALMPVKIIDPRVLATLTVPARKPHGDKDSHNRADASHDRAPRTQPVRQIRRNTRNADKAKGHNPRQHSASLRANTSHSGCARCAPRGAPGTSNPRTAPAQARDTACGCCAPRNPPGTPPASIGPAGRAVCAVPDLTPTPRGPREDYAKPREGCAIG